MIKKMRIKGLPRLENAKDEMQKFTHDGSDDLHFGFASTLSKGMENRVVALSNNSGEINVSISGCAGSHARTSENVREPKSQNGVHGSKTGAKAHSCRVDEGMDIDNPSQ